MPNFKLFVTQPALEAIDSFLSKRPKPKVLRIGVRGGSCHGMKYNIECAESFNPAKDHTFLYHDIAIVVDKKSMPCINGATLLWRKTSKEQGLKFVNPNVKSTCKCGKSFSVN